MPSNSKSARTSRAPLALASDGTIFVNAITLTADDDLDALVDAAKEHGGKVFIAVAVGEGEVRQALRMLDDAVAEIAARVGSR